MADNNIYETRVIPPRERIVWSLATLLFLPLLLASPLMLLDKVVRIPASIAAGWTIICYAIAVHVAWKTLRNKEVTELVPAEKTPEQLQEEKAAAEESVRREAEFYNKWWVRYPIGIGLLWAAGYYYEAHQNKWILPLLMALFGVLAMRELVLIGFGIGGIFLLVQGLASLPVSLAIIIGAIIISSAISNKR